MKPISGLVEVSNDLPRERQSELGQGVVGLGPPDLVCLFKHHSKKKGIPYYHHVAGYPMGSEHSIIDYFTTLLKARPKKILGKVRFEIHNAQFFCWNSFENRDIHINIKNRALASMKIAFPEDSSETNKSHKISNLKKNKELWNQLRISSILRFWMAPSPVFRAIFNYPYKNYPALRLLSPPELTTTDIEYILDHHSCSHELDAALACFVVSLSNFKKITKYLTLILPKMPRVICHFISFFPSHTKYSIALSNISKDNYIRFPDDILLAFSCVHHAIEVDDLTICETAIPILMNGIWSSPEACCAMAKLAVYRKNASDALFFANAACYTKKFVSGVPQVLSFISPKLESKKAPRMRPKMIETELVASQTSGHYNLIYQTIVLITSIASSIKVRTMLKNKVEKKTDKKAEKKEKAFLSENHISNLEQHCPVSEMNMLDDLYDPGVLISNIEVPFYIKSLPISSTFMQISTTALNDIQLRDNVMRTKRIESSQDARNVAIIALKLRDPDLYEVSMSALKKMKKLRVISELMKMRLLTGPKWCPLPKSTEVSLSKMTMNESNSLVVMRQLSQGITSTLS
ncbi:hypothetical protein TRFO_13249 [Tritrichomonas foetus]|uniref:Uncharacterized protein n=1 Tax=Tritrichomonas foetus TaxID=1144522 RepID=A0A1J4L335_9EUKA|nr:hypothetical protein TRFO_13249 [Tritrichomonas foetus]|eukprot:OHT16388.1 hypothetical protein TRFO_13249 [Tritrichomonas foetus]